MPKVAKSPRFRQSTAPTAPPVSKNSKLDSSDGGNPSLSRGQRKRLAKREQYMHKEHMILNALKLKRQDEQKKQIDGLDEMRSALLATVVHDDPIDDAVIPKHNLLRSNKAKHKLLEKEVTQMNLVLQHPAFQADPFATIREHLQNTLAKDAQQQQKQAARHAHERAEKEEQKKVVKKELGAKRKKNRFRATRSKSRR